MAIELIKISEFPQVSEPGDWIVVSDAAGIGYKISKEDFKEWLGTVTVITDKPIALADPAPTMDGVYLPTEPGTYTNAGGLVYDPEGVDAGKYVQFIKNDAVWTKLAVDLPQADLSGTVQKADLKTNTLVDKDSPYIKYNTVIGSTGNAVTNVTSYAGAVSIVDYPLEPNTTYALGGFLENPGKNFALVNGSGEAVQISGLGVLPKIFTTDATHTLLRAFIKYTDSVEPDDNWSETLMLNEGGSLQEASISGIDGKKISASSLESGNVVPSPVSDQNAVNLGYLKVNGVMVSDFGIEYSDNIADPRNIIPDQYIGNTGTIQPGTGWKMIAIDVSGIPTGSLITFGRFTIDSGGYSAFHNQAGLVQFDGSYNNAGLPKTVTKPEGATVLYIDISRPTGTNIYDQLTVNIGSEMIDYIPFATINTIKGFSIAGGGGSSNVNKFTDLSDVPDNIYTGNSGKGLRVNQTADGVDTFVPVEQNTDVSFTSVSAESWIIGNLPVGAGSPPPEVLIGDAWIDSTDDSIKVRRV